MTSKFNGSLDLDKVLFSGKQKDFSKNIKKIPRDYLIIMTVVSLLFFTNVLKVPDDIMSEKQI